MVAFSLRPINVAEVSKNEYGKSSLTGTKGHVLRCDGWISIHFVGFLGFWFSRSVDGHERRNCGDVNFRFHLLLKGAVSPKILPQILLSDYDLMHFLN